MMDYRTVIKEIGRGKAGARALPYAQAFALFGAMLDGEVPDFELGAILLAYRVKGESIEELKAFNDAIAARMTPIATPPLPVVIPSYNGARRRANLLPLLVLLLRDAGIPVLVHGRVEDPNRVTTATILSALGVVSSADPTQASADLTANGLAYIVIDDLAPGLARLLDTRNRLGLRSSAHTVCKMLQPCAPAALRLISVTHPEYMTAMREYFAAYPDNVLLMRGTEGEAIANARRAQAIEWLGSGRSIEVVAPADGSLAQIPSQPATIDAATTAAWIRSVLRHELETPPAIDAQIDAIVRVRAAILCGDNTLNQSSLDNSSKAAA